MCSSVVRTTKLSVRAVNLNHSLFTALNLVIYIYPEFTFTSPDPICERAKDVKVGVSSIDWIISHKIFQFTTLS